MFSKAEKMKQLDVGVSPPASAIHLNQCNFLRHELYIYPLGEVNMGPYKGMNNFLVNFCHVMTDAQMDRK